MCVPVLSTFQNKMLLLVYIHIYWL